MMLSIYAAAWVFLLGTMLWMHRPSAPAMLRFRCWRNKAYAWSNGITWDGHCWDEDKKGVFCMDCGARG